MKALVLAGGFPQIDLIEKLKRKGIYTILADYYQNPVAKEYADSFYCISTLDINAIKDLVVSEGVDFIVTVCTDQALLTMAKVSEELNLPCYLSYQTALDVTNKARMKNVLRKNGINTADYMIAERIEQVMDNPVSFPVIIKPVDCNSSKGVKKIFDMESLKEVFHDTILMSRKHQVIIEEFIDGKELSVDVYIENGKAIVLDVTTSEKLESDDKFIIFRTWHPANVSSHIYKRIEEIVQQIAVAFQLNNSPMLVQMLAAKDDVYVIEFSARTGGGVKHLSILRRTGFDSVSAVIDMTLGTMPKVRLHSAMHRYMVDEYIYCYPGVYDHLEGFQELKDKGLMLDYYVFRWRESDFEDIRSSGDRLGGFTIEADSFEELKRKHEICNANIKAISADGKDIIRHELLDKFDIEDS